MALGLDNKKQESAPAAQPNTARQHIEETDLHRCVRAETTSALQDLSFPIRPLKKSGFESAKDQLASSLGLPGSARAAELPQENSVEQVAPFCRVYSGRTAEILSERMQKVIEEYGGEWSKPAQSGAAGNALALRGYDFDKGLVPDTNLTFDDTLLVSVRNQEKTEVREYRMTTQSNLDRKGVANVLEGEQCTYYLDLHNGKYPAYRMEGDQTIGTRVGEDGLQTLTKINLHSCFHSLPCPEDLNEQTLIPPRVTEGCQTVAANQVDFEKFFVKPLTDAGVTKFPYVVLDAERVAKDLPLERSTSHENDSKLVLSSLRR